MCPLSTGKRTIDRPREPAQQFPGGVTRMSEPCSRKKKERQVELTDGSFPPDFIYRNTGHFRRERLPAHTKTPCPFP
jgi:hypothetical protein